MAFDPLFWICVRLVFEINAYLGLFECIEMGKWPKSTHFERFESLTDTDERFRWI